MDKSLALRYFYTLFVLIVFCLIFKDFINSSSVLMSTDATISLSGKSTSEVLINTMSEWDVSQLMGSPRGGGTQLPSIFLAALPNVVWNNTVYGLACLIVSYVFLAVFERKFNRLAVLLGSLAAFWLGSNFTLIYAGHGLKPYVILFFVCSVACAGIPSYIGGVLWGACVGLMFAQQPDVALFFALFAGAYLILRLWQMQGWPTTLRKGYDWLRVLVPAAIVALLFAAGPLLSGYINNVKDTAQVQTESPQERWEYITQWSFPPEEIIDFIAPNYTGIRSGEPDGPYWGRMGRSAGWENHHQGFMNYKMESLYLGFIPVAFAFFAVFSFRRSKYRGEIIFWMVAMVIALLLSFGKYFPLYALFYQLPVVNNIRNPNKFLQVFQVALAILTVYGMDALLAEKQITESRKPNEEQGKTEDNKQKGKVKSRKLKVDIPTSDLRSSVSALRATPDKPTSDHRTPTSDLCSPTSEIRWFFWGLAGVAVLLLISALVVTLDSTGVVARFVSRGWPQQAAQSIASHKIVALWHAVFMAAVMVTVFSVFNFKPFWKLLRFRNWIAAGLVLIVAADAIKLSRDYVKEMPRSYVEANALTSFLKTNLGHERVALLTQEGIYNIWLTYLLPYNRIPTFNFPAMPRMANDYKHFLQAGSKDPLRMWRFSAVKYLLGPTSFEKQVPPGEIRRVFTYRLAPAPGNNVSVVPAPDGEHAVFELLNTLPRYLLAAEFNEARDPDALARIADRTQPLVNGGALPGAVKVIRYRAGRVELEVNSQQGGMLRVAERWDADWNATVNGNSAPLQRIDYLCQGVNVPPGKNRVILAYRPSLLFFWCQVTGLVILLMALVWRFVNKYRYGPDSSSNAGIPTR